jgi:hypothetical protein
MSHDAVLFAGDWYDYILYENKLKSKICKKDTLLKAVHVALVT